MAEVNTYVALAAPAIDLTQDYLYVRDATGPTGKKATPQALFDANLQGSHSLLGNLTFAGGGTRSVAFTGMSSVTLGGTLVLTTPLITAGGIGVGAPLVCYVSGTGQADYGLTTEAWVSAAVETISASRNATNADLGKTLVYSGTANIILTIPAGLTTGWRVRIVQASTGKITVAGSGVTVNGKQGQTATGGQWHYIEATRLDASTYVVTGDTANAPTP